MTSRHPWIPLILLLLAAGAVVAGGYRLARQEQLVRVHRDRGSLRATGALMQGQLIRLERLYESHLARIAADVPLKGEDSAVKRAGDWLVGLRQISILTVSPSGHYDALQVPMEGGDTNSPALVFQCANGSSLTGPVFVLPEEIRSAAASESGWLDLPGAPFGFWLRRNEGTTVILILDRPAIQAAMNGWFKDWTAKNYRPLNTDHGGDRITGPGNAVIDQSGLHAGEAALAPDFVLPMTTRLGTWEMLSWDNVETRTVYHTPTLTGAAGLALALSLLGLGIFTQQRAALREAAQRVSFINRVSHELRTPLTNILLNVDLLTEAVEDGSPDVIRRLALVKEEGARLGRLIDNILTFSRKEQNRLRSHPSACVPAEVISQALAPFDPALERRSIRVALTGGERTCQLDTAALTQIATNLISNVEKYAAAGGALTITLKQPDGRFVMTVSDHGPGIPPAEATRIFEPFHRLDSRATAGVTGTGLGLAIARDLALRMGGTLRLLPCEEGACFELNVPAQATNDQPPRSAA